MTDPVEITAEDAAFAVLCGNEKPPFVAGGGV